MRKLKYLLNATFILLIATGLRAWNLRKGEPPGFDEIIGSLAAIKPFGAYLRTQHVDLCPPLQYFVLHPLTWINSSLWVMRFPSLIFGALAAAGLYLLGRKCVGDRAAFAAGLLLAMNPLHVFFSQSAQPAALFTLALVIAYFFLIRSSESNQLRDWAGFDLCAIAMLHLHREGAFAVFAFLLLHLGRVLFYPAESEHRRIRRRRLLGTISYNYLIVAAASLPWLSIMPTKAEWFEPKPQLRSLLDVFGGMYFFGFLENVPVAWSFVPAVLLVLLLPPLLRIVRGGGFPQHAAVLLFVLVLCFPFAYSHFGRTRFEAHRNAVLAVPLFCLVAGLLLGRCNVYVRMGLLSLFAAAFLYGASVQAVTRQKASYSALAETIEQQAKPEDLVVFWPDYTVQVGEYFFGSKYQLVSATDLFEKWAEVPRGQSMYFALLQFPGKSAHLYTFPGALEQYSESEILWRDRLNMVVRARDLNMLSLRLWYDDPDTLNVVDAPTTDTQFLFTPADPVFRTKQFHSNEDSLSYELDGRRIVWMRDERADLQLPVTLSPGNYIIRVHCSPMFDLPETGQAVGRTLTVQIRTGDEQKRYELDQEKTLTLPFSTEAELSNLNLNIVVSSVLRIRKPEPGTFGLKIYSIAIDQIGSPGNL
jgi:hypothetical protein